MKNVVKATLGVAMFGSVLFGATAAFGLDAASTPVGGPVNVYVTLNATGKGGTILLTGAIGDYGKTAPLAVKGNVNKDFGKVTLSKGTFEIDKSALNAKLNSLEPNFNKATCSYAETGSGVLTLLDGAGLYKGISGSLNVIATIGGYGPYFKSGKNKGQCNTSDNAHPVSQFSTVTGSGTVSFK